MIEILLLGLLGGLLALDATSVGQFMVSRPLVAGTLAGWALGQPGLGIAVGAILELYLVVSIPAGGARFPESSTATVVAVATATASAGAGALPLAIAIGLVWGQVGGVTITGLRRLNARLASDPERAGRTPRRVATGHLSAIALDFVRGAIVTATGAAAGRVFIGWLDVGWPLRPGPSLGIVLVGGAVSAGILLRDLGGFRRRRVAFVTGLTLGVLGARLL